MRVLRHLISALLLSLAALRGQAAPLPAGLPARPTAPVTDAAGMLSADEVRHLDALLTKVWAQGQGPQIAVVTLPSLEGDSIENVSLNIARGWGLGDKERDDGVLLFIAKADRKLRIEVGTKFEGLLTDVASRRIIADVIVPRFKAGDVDGGVEAGVAHILQLVAPGQGPAVPPARRGSNVPWWLILLLLWIFLPPILRVFGLISATRHSGGRWGGGGGWGSGGGWSGGSSGGGGFSGGGGGFSGGGSSGSW